MNYTKKEKENLIEIALCGSFTFRDHDSFFEIISLIKSVPAPKIVFDLSECDFIDSAALGMFVIAHDEASAKSVTLSMRGATGKVKEVMYAARFDSLYLFEE